MSNLTTVTLTTGVPTAGSGTVSTLDNLVAAAGTASPQVQTVQGITSMTPLKVDGSGVTQPVSVASVPSHAVTNAGTFAVQVTSAPSTAVTNAGTFSVQVSNANANGQATKANSAPVVPATDWVYNTGKYVALPASTTTTIQASTGAIGDYLDHITVFPTTTAPGTIVIKDGATTIATYAGGTGTALLTLTPFTIYVGAVSSVGAWSAVVGSNVAGVATGRFS